MGIPAREIGKGTEANLLWQISFQLEQIIGQLGQINANFSTTTTTTTAP